MRFFVVGAVLFLLIGCGSGARYTSRGTSSNSSLCSSGESCQSTALSLAGSGRYAEASKYFRSACGYGISEGCNSLAFQYANAEGVEQSYTLAYKYWGMACRMGNTLACSNLQLAKDKVAELRREKAQ